MLSLRFLYDSPVGYLITGWKRRRIRDVVMPADEDPNLDDNPFRAAYVRSIPQGQIFKNVLLQGYLAPPDVLVGLEKMEIREDDVFIITYPKSGTTWTEEIVSLIYNGGDVQRVKKEPLIFRVHHLEVGRPVGQLRFLRNLKSPRLMATHLPLPLIPQQLRQAKCKIIYVVRNPKDTAVSYYHHHKMSTFLGNYSGTWDEYLAHFMSGHLVYGSWFDHVLPYWKFCSNHPNKVFFLCYEELKLELPGMVTALSQFLGRNLSKDSVDAICKHCSFEEMKTNSMVNRENLPISDFFDMSKTKFMRKGIIGDWKNHFTPEQSAVFDKLCREKMQDSTLDLVCEPEDAMRRFCTYGRIIYNHPEAVEDIELYEDQEIPGGSLEFSTSSSDDEDTAIRHQSDVTWNCVMPSMQIHMQPDPLIVDFIY